MIKVLNKRSLNKWDGSISAQIEKFPSIMNSFLIKTIISSLLLLIALGILYLFDWLARHVFQKHFIIKSIIIIHEYAFCFMVLRLIIDEIRDFFRFRLIAKIEFKKVTLRTCIIFLLLYAGYLTFFYFRQVIPLHTPFQHEVMLPSQKEKYLVSKILTSVRVVLGDYENYEKKETISRNICATIMVSGLGDSAVGLINWGEDSEIQEIPIKNGPNYSYHTYRTFGLKTVKFRLKVNEQIVQIVDFNNVQKEEISAEINIVQKGD